MKNYQSIADKKDGYASSTYSTPTLSVFSEIGGSMDEERPLFTNNTEGTACDDIIIYEDVHYATPLSTTINLSNTILGTGMLAMPAALASVGLIPGIMLIMYSACASALGLYFLSRCADKVGGRNTSFASLSQLTWPRLGVFFDAAIAIKCFGVAVSYLIIIGDLLPQVILSFYPPSEESALLMDRRFWITLVVITSVGPLGYLRRLDSLKYTSLIALIAVAYLVIIVVYHYISPTFPPPPSESIQYFHFSTKIFAQLPVFVFAFTCHQNIFSVYNELRDNSEKSILRVISSSIGLAAFIYEIVAILGYLSFGKDVRGNIILEYPQSYFVAYGRLAIVMLVIFSYPLQTHPCRISVDKILGHQEKPSIGSSHITQTSNQRHYILTTTIILASYLVAISISQLDVVLSFVGSTGSTTISFILPGLFYFKIHQQDKWSWKRMVAIALSIYGFLVMVICLTFNIKRLL